MICVALKEVKDAIRMWNRRGRFVFTSSSAVYSDIAADDGTTDGGAVTTETSALKVTVACVACTVCVCVCVHVVCMFFFSPSRRVPMWCL
jgi:hypothetical protein